MELAPETSRFAKQLDVGTGRFRAAGFLSGFARQSGASMFLRVGSVRFEIEGVREASVASARRLGEGDRLGHIGHARLDFRGHRRAFFFLDRDGFHRAIGGQFEREENFAGLSGMTLGPDVEATAIRLAARLDEFVHGGETIALAGIGGGLRVVHHDAGVGGFRDVFRGNDHAFGGRRGLVFRGSCGCRGFGLARRGLAWRTGLGFVFTYLRRSIFFRLDGGLVGRRSVGLRTAGTSSEGDDERDAENCHDGSSRTGTHECILLDPGSKPHLAANARPYHGEG